mmetsp:Transcript_122312/g.182780  ORF Transcript_122312/g.182780 Transcript_122312/m.182780 type:complete len:160 (+) Transcript_122312:190-669(+)
MKINKAKMIPKKMMDLKKLRPPEIKKSMMNIEEIIKEREIIEDQVEEVAEEATKEEMVIKEDKMVIEEIKVNIEKMTDINLKVIGKNKDNGMKDKEKDKDKDMAKNHTEMITKEIDHIMKEVVEEVVKEVEVVEEEIEEIKVKARLMNMLSKKNSNRNE